MEWRKVVFSTAASVPRRWCAGGAFVAGLALFVWGQTLKVRRGQRISKLLDRADQLEQELGQLQSVIFDFWDFKMREIGELLGHSGQERVSLYRHGDGHFILLGRFSESSTFHQRGRGMYPEGQGCIGKAWLQGSYFVRDLPDPDENLDNYCQRLLIDYGIPREVTTKFAMKSRCFAAIAIKSAGTSRRAAIIVFESTRARGLRSKHDVESIMKNSIEKDLSFLIDVFDPMMPSPELARKEGF